MKKVLLLAYYYPPMGGAGVQRTAKFVKYLSSVGYIPSVVSGLGDVGSPCTPAVDPTLAEDVNGWKTYQIELSRTDRFKRSLYSNKLCKFISNTLFIWWFNSARKTLEKAVRREKPDVLYVSVSPFAAARVARNVARKYGLPWVLDMRDPWALDPINYYRTKWNYRMDIREMRNMCSSASAVIMNTPRSLEAVKRFLTELPSDKLFCVTNGWDDDICFAQNLNQKNDSSKLTIVHAGYFLTEYAVRVDPNARKQLGEGFSRFRDRLCYNVGRPDLLARSPYYLYKAIRRLLDAGKISEQDISLIFVGATTDHDIGLTRRYGLEKIVQFTGYVNHIESVRYLLQADVLFLPMHKPENGRFPLIVPGKTYEYLAARKPILALLPPGDTRDFVQQSGLGFVCDPKNIEQIAQTLMNLLSKYHGASGLIVEPNEEFIRQFEYKVLTKKLANILNFAVSNLHRD